MLQNFIDYNMYIFKIKKIELIILLIDSIIFILSTYTLINEWSDLINRPIKDNAILIIIIGSIIKFAYDLYKMISQIKESLDLRYGYLDVKAAEKIYDKVEIEKSNENDDTEIYNHNIGEIKERIVISREVDRYIRNNNIEIFVSKEMERNIKNFIKENLEDALPFLRYQYRLSNFYGKMFFNEKKLCLSTDFKIGDNKILCHKGTYYDTFLTNIISGKELKSNKDDGIIASAKSWVPIREKEDKYYLKNITTSVMNNEVGISTLGITRDKYLVIWRQNRIAQSSAGLLVPTGSGSGDWDDMKNSSFNETIINAMNRELWEENGQKNFAKSYNDIGETKIIGYFRWIKKGGKSEFVGISKLNKELIEFSQEKSEVFDRQEYHVPNIEKLKAVIEELLVKNDLSVPLYANLLALKDYVETDSKGAAWLIK